MLLRAFVSTAAIACLIAFAAPTTPPARAAGVVRIPFAPGVSARIIQGYSGGTHTGVDPYALDLVVASGASSGATVVAPVGGTVTWSSGGPRAGNGCLTITMGGGYSLMMCHVIFDRAFGRGERVAAGQRIGTVGPPGTVGNNGTAHVHLDLKARGASVPFASGQGLPLEGLELPARGRSNDWGGTVIPAGGAPAATADTRTTAGATSSRGGSATTASGLATGRPAVVEGTDSCVNVRATPGLAGRLLGCLAEGTRVTITAGPRSADGRAWYQIDGWGWAAGDYLAAV